MSGEENVIGLDNAAVMAALEHILASREFRNAEALSRFLRYIAEETLAGHAETIKEYSIGVAVFRRGDSFDPKADTIVRVQARRLRAKLAEYYEHNGETAAVRIELPKGTYVPTLTARTSQPSTQPDFTARWLYRRRRAILFAALTAFGLLAALFVQRRTPPARGASYEAIAVLPFESLSAAADQQYLAYGLTEALITNLGQIPDLRVIARTSVSQYRGTKKPIHEIARELKVDVLVEGTITQSGEQLRVTANLIQASPEKHIWANSYERNLRATLALQNEIASAIAADIQSKLKPGQHSRVAASRPLNPEAQLAYWKALYFLEGRRDRESAHKSVEYAEQAVRTEPGYAAAQAALARAYLMLSNLGAAYPREVIDRAKSAARTAVSLDNSNAEAHVALSSILFAYDWDWTGAEREARRALSMNPNNADARLCLANYLAAVGRADEAVTEIKRARELNPFSFYINRNVGRLLYLARRYDEALAELRQAGDMQPDSPTVDTWIYKSLLNKGLASEAVEADLRVNRFYNGFSEESLDALRSAYSRKGLPGYWTKLRTLLFHELGGKVPGSSYDLAEINAYLGDKEDAFRWLEKAFEERTGDMPWIKVSPSLDSLRSDERFAGLLARMGLAP